MMNGPQNNTFPGNYPGNVPGQQTLVQGGSNFPQNGLPPASQFPSSKATPGDSGAPGFGQFVSNPNSAFNPTISNSAPTAPFPVKPQFPGAPVSFPSAPYNMPSIPVPPMGSSSAAATEEKGFMPISRDDTPGLPDGSGAKTSTNTGFQSSAMHSMGSSVSNVQASPSVMTAPGVLPPQRMTVTPELATASNFPPQPLITACGFPPVSNTMQTTGLPLRPVVSLSSSTNPSGIPQFQQFNAASGPPSQAVGSVTSVRPNLPPGQGMPPGMMGPASMAFHQGGGIPNVGMPIAPGISASQRMMGVPNVAGPMGMPSGTSSVPGMPPVPSMPATSNIYSTQGLGSEPGVPSGQPFMAPGMPPAPGMPLAPGMMPGQGMPPAKPRLSLDSMPSEVQVVEEDRSTRSGLFPTGYPNAEHPPLCTTEFFAQDQGNCNPKFMRSTLYVAPASSDILKNTQIPFAVAISPFASLTQQELRPPIVDLGEMGPVRCARCKAYMCAFMEFQDGGRRFKCPYCLASTKVEDAYFAHLDPSGRRSDIQHRPEQFLGSYDFVATKPYCKNGVMPKEPAFIFMLDVSYTAVHSGLVSTFCKNIRGMLERLPKDVHEEKSSMRIGFVTYDQTVHFYNLKNSLGQPKMTVVSDVQDVFTPLVDGFLVTLEEAEPALESLLVEVEKMFADTRITDTILGPVIQAGLDALKCSDRAGKLFIFHTNLPVHEAPGKLKNRDDRKLLGTDKEKNVLQPAVDFYGKLGEECVKSGCAVDLFLFPNSFVDIASLAPVCTLSGGSIYKYQYFEASKDSVRFLYDLSHDISREIAFDVMMRVRTSTGLRPTGFFGSFFMDNSTDMEMGAIDCDKAAHIEMRHDDKLPEGSAHIQCAVLFTSCSGQRRLRVHNLALAVSSDYNQLYRVADHGALVSFLFKQAELMVRDKSPKEMREAVTVRCAQMLATYREKCSEQAPHGQLILPECLKLLPLYGNCIIRNDAVSGGSDCTVDDRAWLMSIVPSLSVDDAMRILYPLVYPVSDLALENLSDELTLPGCIRASYEYFNPDKAYLICNGVMTFLWIGLGVPQDWVQDVFNANSVTHLNTENHVVPERDNARSRALRKLIERSRRVSTRSMKLFVIRQQDALEAWMKRFLVEDQTANTPSYVDYLCTIHKEIRSLLS